MYPTRSVLSTGAQTNMHVFAVIVLLILRLGDVVHGSNHSSEKGSYSSSQAVANLLTKNAFRNITTLELYEHVIYGLSLVYNVYVSCVYNKVKLANPQCSVLFSLDLLMCVYLQQSKMF